MKDELTQLTRIYNTLLTIGTKGEDTLTMADCLRALKASIENINELVIQQETSNVETKSKK